MSASLRMRRGLWPPSSRATRLRCRPAFSASVRPTWLDPVKLNLRTLSAFQNLRRFQEQGLPLARQGGRPLREGRLCGGHRLGGVRARAAGHPSERLARVWVHVLVPLAAKGVHPLSPYVHLVLAHLPSPSPIPQYLSLIHISEPTRLRRTSYAVFCLKKKKKKKPKI